MASDKIASVGSHRILRRTDTGAVFRERHISRFNKSVNDYYSDTENKTFTRMRNLLIYFVIISCLSFVVNLLGKSYFINHGTLLAPLSLLFGTFLFLIGYEGHKRTFTAKEMTSDTEACSEFGQSPIRRKNIRAIISGIFQSGWFPF